MGYHGKYPDRIKTVFSGEGGVSAFTNNGQTYTIRSTRDGRYPEVGKEIGLYLRQVDWHDRLKALGMKKTVVTVSKGCTGSRVELEVFDGYGDAERLQRVILYTLFIADRESISRIYR